MAKINKDDKKAGSQKVRRNRNNGKGGIHHTAAQKAEIVRWINRMYADGADLQSACAARSVSHNTYWVWRNETDELIQHYKDCQVERHAVRAERLKETGYASLEYLAKEHKRSRVVREGKNMKKKVDGKEVEVFVPTKVTVHDETFFPNLGAVRMILSAYEPELFGKADTSNELVVTFTQNAKPMLPLADDDETDEI